MSLARMPLLLVLVACLLSGCIILPIPMGGNTGAQKGIDEGTVSFIRLGSTNREDVVLRLGSPDDTIGGSTFIYRIEKYGWGNFGIILLPTEAMGYGVRKLQTALVIEFDENSVVTAYRFEDRGDTITGWRIL